MEDRSMPRAAASGFVQALTPAKTITTTMAN
jgi:hypothetical protein